MVYLISEVIAVVWFIIAAAVAAVLLMAAFTAVNLCIRTADYDLFFESLPDEAVGKRVVLLSDLHDKHFGKRNGRLIRAVDRCRPDIVLFGGDMHNHGSEDSTFYEFSQDICERYETFSVIGNHEVGRDNVCDEVCEKYLEELSRAGVKTLRNEAADIFNGAVRLYGVTYGAKELPVIDRTRFSVLLVHDPKVFDSVRVRPDVTLSGHIHGGFIELPFVGAVFSPGEGAGLRERFARKYFFPKYYKGVYGDEGGYLVVGRGLGNSVLPFRLIAPEIVTVTLRKKNK